MLASLVLYGAVAIAPMYIMRHVHAPNAPVQTSVSGRTGPGINRWEFILALLYMVCVVAACVLGIIRMHRAEVSERWKAVALVPSFILLAFYLLMLSGMFI